MLTDQQYFDGTVEYLRGQDNRCYSTYELACLYKHNGNACAIGSWIPDDYIDKLEHTCTNTANVEVLLEEFPELRGVAVPATFHGAALAADLQDLHDTDYFRKQEYARHGGLNEQGERKAKCIAEDYGLTYTPPKEK